MELKGTFFSTFSIALLLLFLQPCGAKEENNKLDWTTDYESVSKCAKETSRPILVYFSGSDWCGWCNKLEDEIFNTAEFTDLVAHKLLFVKIGYPTNQNNERLKKRFSIRSFPTVLLLDSEQQPIGVTGYRAGGAKRYAQHLMKMIDDYVAYKQQMQRLNTHALPGKDLKRLYQKARELGLREDQNLLIRIGMQSDLEHFFLTERYRFLVSNGTFHSNEAAKIKKRLYHIDPENAFLTHYQLAIIDFERLSREREATKEEPDKIVAPLLDYIETFGDQGTENVWRLYMVIYQVYLEHNLFIEALKFAKKAHAAAPSSIQPEIAIAIQNIEKQMN